MIELNLTNTNPSTRSALAISQPSAAVTLPTVIQASDFCPCDYECDYEELALADDTGEDLQNDYYSILVDLITGSDTVVFTLINKTTLQEFVLSDDTYGIYYPVGTFTGNELKVGIKIEWSKVLALIGTGVYQVKVEQTTFGDTIEELSHLFRLKLYTPKAADLTVRLETESNAFLENGLNYKNTGWKRSVRLPAYLYGRTPVLEADRIEYNDRRIEDIQNKLITEWTLETKLLPQEIYLPLIYDKMFSDNIYLTSYNLFGEQKIQRLNVYLDSVEEHKEWSKSRLSAWSFKFIEKLQNNIKRWQN